MSKFGDSSPKVVGVGKIGSIVDSSETFEGFKANPRSPNTANLI